MYKRTYELKRRDIRDMIDLRDYESVIIQAYRKISPNVKVVVEEKYYCVYGNITNTELRNAGSYIAKSSGLGKFCKRYGKSGQLFKRMEIREI